MSAFGRILELQSHPSGIPHLQYFLRVSLMAALVRGTGVVISPPKVFLSCLLGSGLVLLKGLNISTFTPFLQRNSFTTMFPTFVFSDTPYFVASAEELICEIGV